MKYYADSVVEIFAEGTAYTEHVEKGFFSDKVYRHEQEINLMAFKGKNLNSFRVHSSIFGVNPYTAENFFLELRKKGFCCEASTSDLVAKRITTRDSAELYEILKLEGGEIQLDDVENLFLELFEIIPKCLNYEDRPEKNTNIGVKFLLDHVNVLELVVGLQKILNIAASRKSDINFLHEDLFAYGYKIVELFILTIYKYNIFPSFIEENIGNVLNSLESERSMPLHHREYTRFQFQYLLMLRSWEHTYRAHLEQISKTSEMSDILRDMGILREKFDKKLIFISMLQTKIDNLNSLILRRDDEISNKDKEASALKSAFRNHLADILKTDFIASLNKADDTLFHDVPHELLNTAAAEACEHHINNGNVEFVKSALRYVTNAVDRESITLLLAKKMLADDIR